MSIWGDGEGSSGSSVDVSKILKEVQSIQKVLGGRGTSGRMAARGAAAAAQKIALRMFAQQVLASKLQRASMSLVSFGPGERPVLQELFPPNPQVKKLGEQIAKMEAKKTQAKTAKKIQNIAAKQQKLINKRQAKLAKLEPQATIFYSASAGLNYGPTPGAYPY